jgi:hypothetical protein
MWDARVAVISPSDQLFEEALERRALNRDRGAALSFCFSIGFIRKPLRTFRSDALDPFAFPYDALEYLCVTFNGISEFSPRWMQTGLSCALPHTCGCWSGAD